jgi:hypothetical protein
MHHALNGAGVCAELSAEPVPGQRYWARFDIAGRAAVVFGGRGAAVRHVASLLQANASVTVVSSEADATIEDLSDRGLLDWHKREFEDKDLKNVWLAIAATERADTDGRISLACEDRRLWCIREPGGGHRISGLGRVTLVGAVRVIPAY